MGTHSSTRWIVYVLAFICSLYSLIYAVQGNPDSSSNIRSELSRPSTPAMSGSQVGSSPPTLSTEFKRVCRGTNTGLGHSVGHYHEYKARYTNCTYVDGNLEIMFIDQPDFDLSFLRDIREVTGYVLIVANYVSYLNLTNLRVIRGRSLYEHEGRYYSLYVALNYDSTKPGVGLKELRMVSLQEILAGSVFFFENVELCYEETVAWDDIVTGEGAQVVHKPSTTPQRAVCGVCDSHCAVLDRTPCWGTGPEFCQKLTKLSCSPQCDGRCFGPLPNQCCNSECAGGCTGPTKSQCWACKNFDNDELCEKFCPPEFIYSPVLFQRVRNPRAKFAYGSLCVDKCPSHLMADQGACVQDCGTGRIANKDQICSDCVGPCPKTCTFPYDIIDAQNIHNLTDCTIVQGHIKIQDVSFDGDDYMNIPPMPVSMLSILETIQEVTDYVQVQASHYKFRSLSYLKNLQVIQGRNLGNSRTSLQVFHTSLEMLGLVSLREVRFGHIYIANNSRLCYASSVRWESLRSEVAQKVIVQHNRNGTACAIDHEVCSPECSDSGCWGPSDDQCISCRNYRLGNRCLNRCEAMQGVYTSGPLECRLCHTECKNNCTDNTANKCDECRNARDGPYCVSACPDSKYRDENGICQFCHEYCEVGKGCAGPRNSVGDGACHLCSLVLLSDDNSNVTQCLPPDSNCEDGYFKQNYHRLPGTQACRRCDPECRTCSGPGLSFCTSCVNYKQENRCVRECSQDYYVVPSYNGEARTCEPCDARCLRCTGPTSSDCILCKQYKVYADGTSENADQRFNCSEKCPDYAPHKITITLDGETETVCVSEDSFEKTKQGIIIGTVIGVLVLLAIVTAAVVIFLMQRRHAEKDRVKLARQMTGFDETVPLSPTDAKPDMSTLTLIKESDLRVGSQLGSGAFGTVFMGYWIRNAGEKIPVAIKVLSDGTSPSQNKELLEEARIMASVIHPCCVQIRAVCMTAQIMLISELMPMGCLLDFVRKEGHKLSSQTLILWSRQIAEGMNHLETKGIVHRDLAARNVLVQTLGQVKITDFGLAKLLEYKEDQFFASGGKMPIKWLALECIQHRLFTHKSDVWSFGVTLWELYTYGQRPYENIRAIELPELLGKGERLSQPAICTIDVWLLIIKCWQIDAAERPSFSELVQEFGKMMRTPQRYLYVGGEYKMNDSDGGKLHGNGSRPSSVSDRYLQPRASKGHADAAGKEMDDGAEYVFGNNSNDPTSLISQPRPRVQQRQMSTGGSRRNGASNPARTSLRYCSEPSVHAAASNAAHQMLDGATGAPAEEAEYMQPIIDGAVVSNMKYIVEGRSARVRDAIDEEGDCDDDGFDSETMTITPTASNEYYNSLEQLNVENLPLKNIFAAKHPPLRVYSESRGSLDTDATGSVDGSDHDYYNELPAMANTPLVSLDPKSGGVAKWSASGTQGTQKV